MAMLKHLVAAVAVLMVMSGSAFGQGACRIGWFEHAAFLSEQRDHEGAFNVLLPCAERGYVAAQNNVGVMYDTGTGVPQNYAEAVHWYRLAAEQGDSAAQNNLGFMYEGGFGVPQDYVLAHMWHNIAAANGSPAQFRDWVAELMTTAQITEAQQMARAWFEAHPN